MQKLEIANDTRFLRNKDLISIDSLDKVAIIGLGGIGSFLIQSLTIMGFKTIKGYDDDVVERHNLSSTAYFVEHVGKLKTEAAKILHSKYSDKKDPSEMITHPSRENTNNNQWFFPINNKFEVGEKGMYAKTIVCTDDMESRYVAYNTWLKYYSNNPEAWFIDARMGATSIELVTVRGGEPMVGDYMKHWLPTKSVAPAPCSMKHTVFATLNIASLVTAQVYNLVGNLAYYDYIWSSLSPINIHYGTLIVPNLNNKELNDKSKESKDQLVDNAIRSNVFSDRAT